jgi:hypothetical protein
MRDITFRKTTAVILAAGAQDMIRDFNSDYDDTYDHPYFEQIFLSVLLASVGYPDSLHPDADTIAIERLFLVPRIAIGVLSVRDTFFYLIALCQ